MPHANQRLCGTLPNQSGRSMRASCSTARPRMIQPVTGRNIDSFTLRISHAPMTMPMHAGGSIRRT